jgi:hypothetical protein
MHYPRTASIALILLLLGSCFVRAREAPAENALARRVAAAHRSDLRFEPIELFKNTTGLKHPAMLRRETLLTPLSGAITALYERHPEGITLSVHDDAGKTFDLELLRTQPVSEQPNTGFIDAGGRHRSAMAPGVHYQGIVTGRSRSLAALSVFANNDLMLLFADSSGNYIAGKLEDSSGLFVFYRDQELLHRPPVRCETESAEAATGAERFTGAKTAQSKSCSKVAYYWEIGYGLYTQKGSSLTNTGNYVLGLFNQVQAFYAADGIALELKSMYIWTAPEAYSIASSSLSARAVFGAYWAANGERFDGDMGHLITRTPNNLGGRAWLNSYCSKINTQAFSDIYGSYNSIPVYSWDVEVVAHETGHNLGSPHTQSCSWMTGPGRTCGAIDDCAALEDVPSNCNCSATYQNSDPLWVWQGTLMSYCHLTGRGINLANGLGPLPSALIRNQISTFTHCLQPAMSATLTPFPVCNSDGLINLSFPGNNFGTPPYSFAWSTGAHTQNLLGISVPGAYSVTISDSTGCSLTLGASVPRRPHPGDGIAPTINMPVCCTTSATPLIIRATAPQHLGSCESVYWLRSTAPLASVAAALQYFDTTAAVNILPATNPDSIKNGLTGPALEIYPPVSCATPFSYYYTPVVVTSRRGADSLLSSASAGTPYLYGGFYPIGASAILPDQLALLDSCRYADTPAVQTITVRITGYTGRTNRLELLVIDTGVAGIVARVSGLPGNGSYVLNLQGTAQDATHSLQVSAEDFDFDPLTYEPAPVSASISATRRIVFSHRNAGFVESCTPGTPVQVSFAQSGCTKLQVHHAAGRPAAHLIPNPARGEAFVEFVAAVAGTVALSATDLRGRTVLQETFPVPSGQHRYKLNTGAWPRGMYMIRLRGTDSETERMKLFVE